MPELKLQKMSDRLYHEPCKDGEPLKWEKRLEFLDMELTDIRVELGVSITRSRPSDEKYTEYFGWRITATGHLKDRIIGLIRGDGTVSSEDFDCVEVILSPRPDSEREKATGWLSYNNADNLERKDRPQPRVTLALPVPSAPLKELCSELLSTQLVEVNVGADVDIFQSEIERRYSDPWSMQVYFVEEAELFNTAFLFSLNASRLLNLTKTPPENAHEKVDQGKSGKNRTGAAATGGSDQRQSTASFSVEPESVGLIVRRLEMIGIATVLVAIILFLMLLFK